MGLGLSIFDPNQLYRTRIVHQKMETSCVAIFGFWPAS